MRIDAFFEARTIAVVGASPDHYFSDRLRENLEAGSGSVTAFPVNPSRRRVWGRRCYPDLASLPEKPDLVLVLAGAQVAVETIRAMTDLGLERAIVLASGFDRRQRRDLAGAGLRVRILGPESLGLMDVPAGRLLFCGRLAGTPPAGRVSIVSCSGGLLVECLRILGPDPRWGIRRAVCCGREAGVGAADAIETLASDPETDALVLILERDASVASLAGPLEALASQGKEIVLFSTAGRGLRDPSALASGEPGEVVESNAVEALARATGALLARDIDEVAEAAALVSSRPQGRSRGGAAFIVSVSAGVGQWMRSASFEADLPLAVPRRALVKRLARILPAGAPATNPLDLTAAGVTDPSILEEAVRACAAQEGTGAILAGVHPPAGRSFSDGRNARWLEFLAGQAASSGLLVMAVQPTAGVAGPFDGVVRGIGRAARLARWWIGPRPPGPRSIPEGPERPEALRVLHGPARTLSEPSSRRLLSIYGLPFDPWHLAESPSQAAGRVRSLGADACLRLASPDVPADAGGCSRAPVRGDAAARDAYREIVAAGREILPGARILGVLVTVHRPERGALFATTFSQGDGSPPLIACGIGGRARDEARSYVPAICPLAPAGALALAAEAAPGRKGLERLADLLERLSRLAHEMRSEVGVVDIPAIVQAGGAWRCLGATVRIRRPVEGA